MVPEVVASKERHEGKCCQLEDGLDVQFHGELFLGTNRVRMCILVVRQKPIHVCLRFGDRDVSP